MSQTELARNLRLLCSFGRSVSEVCRQLNINRQQFSRYLNGKAFPSLATLRRICDYFDIDEHEIFLDSEAFRNRIRVRSALPWGAENPSLILANRLVRRDEEGERNLKKIRGCYHAYYRQASPTPRIIRYFVRFEERQQQWCSVSIERFAAQPCLLPRVLRYDGIVTSMGNKIFVFHRTRGIGTWWTTAFQMAAYDPPVAFAGLTMGVRPETGQPICMRVLLLRLPSTMRIREALGACGNLALDDPTLPEMVSTAVLNDISPTDIGFVSRI